MENNDQPNVTISKAEYDQLQQQAAAPITWAPSPPPPPAPAPPQATILSYNEMGGDSSALKKSKMTKIEIAWFITAVVLLGGAILPGGGAWIGFGAVFFAPVLVFATVAAAGFFKDASEHTKTAKGLVLVFKIIGTVIIAWFIFLATFIAFAFAFLSTHEINF